MDSRVDDPALASWPDDVQSRAPFGPRTIAVTYASGFLMGSADLVPGVSGGTIALVVGIYDRLVANIRQGARAASLIVRAQFGDGMRALRYVEATFLLPLLAGIVTAVLVLAGGLEYLLENQPELMAAAFFGLVLGSAWVALEEVEDRRPAVYVAGAGVAVATFLLLGLRTGRFEDPSLLVVFAGGALAIVAMILPGISGSFILLMIGLYEFLLGAVNDRDLATLTAAALGAVFGLGSFATLLNWLLKRYHDIVMGALIGLMVGSLRVLWPWPAGEDGVGDTTLGAPVSGDVLPALGLTLVGLVFVVVVARLARRLSEADD